MTQEHYDLTREVLEDSAAQVAQTINEVIEATNDLVEALLHGYATHFGLGDAHWDVVHGGLSVALGAGAVATGAVSIASPVLATTGAVLAFSFGFVQMTSGVIHSLNGSNRSVPESFLKFSDPIVLFAQPLVHSLEDPALAQEGLELLGLIGNAGFGVEGILTESGRKRKALATIATLQSLLDSAEVPTKYRETRKSKPAENQPKTSRSTERDVFGPPDHHVFDRLQNGMKNPHDSFGSTLPTEHGGTDSSPGPAERDPMPYRPPDREIIESGPPLPPRP